MSVLSVSSPSMVPNTWHHHHHQQQQHHSNNLAIAKRKLKHAIEQSNNSNNDNNNNNSCSSNIISSNNKDSTHRINSASPEQCLAHGRVTMVADSPHDKYKDIFQDGDTNRDENYEHRKNRTVKTRLSEDCSPEEKRQRFLERNRAAASRCRQKRKQWVNQLESKSHDLMTTNNMLINEINALRREVAQLKALLVAHKDCPVTIQQKQLLNDMTPGSYVAAVSDGHIIAIQHVNSTVTTAPSSAEQVATNALRDMASRVSTHTGQGVVKAAPVGLSGGQLVPTS